MISTWEKPFEYTVLAHEGRRFKTVGKWKK